VSARPGIPERPAYGPELGRNLSRHGW
jgi:hypothetical protein